MSERAVRLRDEIAWQEKHLASLRRDWARLPYLLVLMSLAIPGGLVWGLKGVLFAVAGAAVITGIAAYLIHGHRTEYEGKIAQLRRDLSELEGR